MAYVKRPIVQSAEFFRPDVYITFRSTDTVNEDTSEVKKWGVFVVSRKNDKWEYESQEINKLEFYSLMILDKLESEYERSDLVKNAYQWVLQIKDKKTFRLVCEAKFDNNLKKFVDVKSTDELDWFKVKKVVIWQLKDTDEIFTLELAWMQARNLMAKNFSRNNLFNMNYDYKQTDEEKEKQKETVSLFMDWVDLTLTPSKDKFKVGKDKAFKNMYLLNLKWDIDEEVKLWEKALNTISILENQLSWVKEPSTSANEAEEVFAWDDISDMPF